MHLFAFILALLTAVNVATCYYGRDDTSRYIQYLRERSQMEKLRSQFAGLCPGKDDEIDEAVIQLKKCSDEIDENTETVCSIVNNHFLRCSKPFIQLLETCVPDESKGIPELIFQGMKSGVSHLCKTDGEHIFELANTCVFKMNLKSQRCERRMKTKLQQYKNSPPSKIDICELVQTMKPCLHNHLQDSCGNQITRESFMGLFDAITLPCKNLMYNSIDNNDLREIELVEKF